MNAIFPLQTILFQLLLLLISIAIDATIFHRKLKILRKSSIEYAISVNLVATVIGWIGFFYIQDRLNFALKAQLISYVFFGRFFEPRPASLTLYIALAGVIDFFLSFTIKLKGLDLLQALLSSSDDSSPSENRRQRPSLSTRLNQAMMNTKTSKASIVLLANSVSHTAIVAIVFLRSVWLGLL